MSYCTETAEGAIINVKAQPRSSKAGVDGLLGDAVKVRIKCAPVDGKANAALLRFLAGKLGVPKKDVELCSGAASRDKRVFVSGVTVEKIIELLS